MDYFGYIFKSQIEKCIFRSINSLKSINQKQPQISNKIKM